jgi:alanine dehydrogenase
MAMGVEAWVTVIDKSLPRLYELDLQFGSELHTLYSTVENIENEVTSADLVIGAVLVPGAAAPKLITREMIQRMRPGSVFVDIAIDQGGCAETSRATTHAHPTYVESGVVHYCVTNMPGAVPRTSTFALNNATLPFVLALATKGWKQALSEDVHLRAGLNIAYGRLTQHAVGQALGIDSVAPEIQIKSERPS